MDELFIGSTFRGFGPDALHASCHQARLQLIEGLRPSSLRRQVREIGLRQPGVYGMFDSLGRLIYIGKAKSLRGRLLSYFRPHSRDAKAGRIIRHTAAIAWEPAPSEFAALLRELELIRRWRPRCNVQGQPNRRRRTYVCLGRRPAPYVFLSSRPPGSAAACYGPVPAGETVREAARRLNDAFGLRDCPQKQTMIFADQTELFPEPRAAGCLRHAIGTCLGPCAAACTRAAYQARVHDVRRFLDGQDMSLLETMERDMTTAAQAMAFERAAALRDRWQTLRWLTDRLARLRRAAEMSSFVYPVAGHEGKDVWYLIRSGRVVAATAAPRCGRTARAADALVRRQFLAGTAPAASVAANEVDLVLLVEGWFRLRPEEAVLTPAVALALCEPLL